jgi:NADH:ubiquinone oxidoreductase subunit C
MLFAAARQRVLPSIERLFRNARWLEREVGEMHGWFFSAKRDRRALFLMPLFM